MALGDQSSSASVVRVAAVGDLHCTRSSHGAFQTMFSQVSASADMLLLAGDLTDTGLPDEARILAREIASLHVPAIGVFGNHDYESGHQDEVRTILTDAGMTILDGEATEVRGIGIAGVKGFAGGFGQGALGPWGEPAIKQFVHEAVNEALKLEASLARLRTKHRSSLLHYSPIQETVEGEPPEIFAVRRLSRLEEPISRFRLDGLPRPRASRASRGVRPGSCAGLQRLDAAADPGLSRSTALPGLPIPVDAPESAPAAMHGGL